MNVILICIDVLPATALRCVAFQVNSVPQKLVTSRTIVALLSASFIFAQSVMADPFVAKVRYADRYAGVIAHHRSHDNRENFIEKIDPVRFTVDIAAEGTINVVLNRQWSPRHNAYFEALDTKTADPQRPILLRGYALGSRHGAAGRARIPVAATLFDKGGDRIQGRLYFGAHRRSAAMYTVDFSINSGVVEGTARVHRASRYARPADWCGNSAAAVKAGAGTFAAPPSSDSVNATALKVVEISTDADTDWFSTYNSSSNAEIQSILNAVETIYQDQLGMTFDLITQNVVTDGSRYTSSNVETLLDSFKDFTNTNQQLGTADVYHLFTGKDTFLLQNGTPNPNVIGLAYTGVVCEFPDFAYGLTEDFTSSLNSVTTAHEIGHNFNAAHDAAGTIMGTQLDANNPPTEFSATSRSQITTYVADHGSCLSTQNGGGGGGGGGVTPEPTPTGDLAVSFSGSLSSDGTVDFSLNVSGNTQRCTVTIRGAPKKSQVIARGKMLTSFSSPGSVSTLQGLVKRKTAARDTAGKPIKVFLSAIYDCGSDGVGSTRMVTLKPSKVRSSKKAVSPGSWLTLLGRSVVFAGD